MIAMLLGLTLLATGVSVDSLSRTGRAEPQLVARVQSGMRGAGYLRLTTERSRFDVRADTVDSLGFAGLHARPGTPTPPNALAWSDLARVGALEPSTVPGAILGGVVAGLVAASLVTGPTADRPEPMIMTAAISGGALGGAALGGTIGSKILREHPISTVVPWGPPKTLGQVARSAGGGEIPPPSGGGARPSSGIIRVTSPLFGVRRPAASGIRAGDIGRATEELRPHQRLRIRLRDQSEWIGRARRADAVGLHGFRLERFQGSVRPVTAEVPWSEIATLDRECGRSGQGALALGLGFGSLGALFGAAVAGGLGGTSEEMAGGAAFGFGVLGTIGAGIGAAIGTGLHRWKPVY